MLVYKIEPHSSYTGGCALIAAHNITEVIQFSVNKMITMIMYTTHIIVRVLF